jgi:hypothetical protein
MIKRSEKEAADVIFEEVVTPGVVQERVRL